MITPRAQRDVCCHTYRVLQPVYLVVGDTYKQRHTSGLVTLLPLNNNGVSRRSVTFRRGRGVRWLMVLGGSWTRRNDETMERWHDGVVLVRLYSNLVFYKTVSLSGVR